MELLQCRRHSPESWPNIHLTARQMFMLGNILRPFVQSVVRDTPFRIPNITFTSWSGDSSGPGFSSTCIPGRSDIKISNTLDRGSALITPQMTQRCVNALVGFPCFHSSVNTELLNYAVCVVTAVELMCQHEVGVTGRSRVILGAWCWQVVLYRDRRLLQLAMTSI